MSETKPTFNVDQLIALARVTNANETPQQKSKRTKAIKGAFRDSLDSLVADLDGETLVDPTRGFPNQKRAKKRFLEGNELAAKAASKVVPFLPSE